MPPWMLPPAIIDQETIIVDPGTAISPPTMIDQGIVGLIEIFSPETNDFVISYTLNGTPFSMSPGQVHTIESDRTWTIEYLGSETLPISRYSLASGRYKFKRQDGVIGLFATRDVPGAVAPVQETPEATAPVPRPPSATLSPPVPAAATGTTPSSGKITIFNRPTNRFQMVYALNDQPYTMKPGDVQEFDNDRTWNIQFLGSSTGDVSSFPLDSGIYEFMLGEKGVELWIAEGLPEKQVAPPARNPVSLPSAAPPRAPAPSAPSPMVAPVPSPTRQ